MNYDFIIAGGGCAGLSLTHAMLNHPALRDSRILIVDMDLKKDNDRTWCYWEKEEGPFEHLVYKFWDTLEFKTEDFVNQFDLEEYRYKMIRGIDFYDYILEEIKSFDNVTFVQERITALKVEGSRAILETEQHTYYADYIFNSTGFFNPTIDQSNSLLQHFMGWVITTDEPSFNSEVGTLMDFSLSQNLGATFMYVLPINDKEALVEYTLFNEDTLSRDDYVEALRHYIQNDLRIDKFKIKHEEYGIIPMSKARFPSHYKQKVIHIGTAGGNTKASSGYTFKAIQNNTALIIEKLANGSSPILEKTFRDKMFDWYDMTLLDVIIQKKMTGKEIFSKMFQKIPPEEILSFLGNESTFAQELKIMISLTSMAFVTSGMKQLMKRQ